MRAPDARGLAASLLAGEYDPKCDTRGLSNHPSFGHSFSARNSSTRRPDLAGQAWREGWFSASARCRFSTRAVTGTSAPSIPMPAPTPRHCQRCAVRTTACAMGGLALARDRLARLPHSVDLRRDRRLVRPTASSANGSLRDRSRCWMLAIGAQPTGGLVWPEPEGSLGTLKTFADLRAIRLTTFHSALLSFVAAWRPVVQLTSHEKFWRT